MMTRLVILCALCASAVSAQIDRAMMDLEWITPGTVSELVVKESSAFIPDGVNSGLTAFTSWYTGTAGAAQILHSGFTPIIQSGRSFSIGGWIRVATNAGDAVVMASLVANPGAYCDLSLYASNIGILFSVRDDDSSTTDRAAISTDPRDGRDHHLVGVYDASAGFISLYFDGVLLTNNIITTNSSGTKSFTNAPFGLGACTFKNNPVNRPIRGSIGPNLFYKPRALSAAEVGELFSSRK